MGYTISALTNDVAFISHTCGNQWAATSNATVSYIETSGVYQIISGNLNFQLLYSEIDSVGGDPPSEDPETLVGQIVACFPITGTVSLTPSVTLTDTVIQNLNIEILPVTLYSNLDVINTDKIDNPYCKGAIIGVYLSDMSIGGNVDVVVRGFDDVVSSYFEIKTHNNAAATHWILIYPGASTSGDVTPAAPISLPKKFDVQVTCSGTGTIQITAQFLV